MARIDEHPVGRTTLIGNVADINERPEHMRIGLSWSLMSGLLYIENRPRQDANMANPLGICEEIKASISSGGVCFDWYYKNDTYHTFKITKDEIIHNIK